MKNKDFMNFIANCDSRVEAQQISASLIDARSLLLAFLVVISMALGVPAFGQLPVGGFLGPDPAEEDVEESVEEQVEEDVEEVVEEEIVDAVEDSVEDSFEDSVEQVTEQNIQENIEDNIEDTIEQTLDATIEDSVDETVVQTVEESVEESVAEAVEGGVEDSITETVEAGVDAAVAESVEDQLESSVEETVVDAVEDSVEESVAETVAEASEENVEASVEEAVETSVETRVEDTVAESVEEAVYTNFEVLVESSVAASTEEAIESSVEESVADSVEASVENSVEESVASSVEESVEDSVEESVAEAVDESVSDAVEASLEESVAQNVEAAVEDETEQRLVLAVEERVESEIDEILDGLESDLEVDEARISKEQWLVMAVPEVFAELSDEGFLFDTVTELPGLGLRLAEVAAPSTFDITKVRDGVMDIVGKDRAEVDLNHIYTAGAPDLVAADGMMPRSAMPLPEDLADMDVKVGMIDSGVDTTHPALAQSRIETRSFARPGAASPDFHGTAIASIIAANSPEYQGLAPNAELFAASVFELDGKKGEIASTVSLIRALDWLISADVDVVNISLAGPPNRLLEKALERAADQEMVVMAAAGNGGPVARPMYPAAYDSVVAVTAVDASQQVFRLANRGDYLALAAPGVDLRHAAPGGGYAASSGTSFAVPFAVTAAARLSHLRPSGDIISMLLESAVDLGPPGRDSIYGYGLLTLSSL